MSERRASSPAAAELALAAVDRAALERAQQGEPSLLAPSSPGARERQPQPPKMPAGEPAVYQPLLEA